MSRWGLSIAIQCGPCYKTKKVLNRGQSIVVRFTRYTTYLTGSFLQGIVQFDTLLAHYKLLPSLMYSAMAIDSSSNATLHFFTVKRPLNKWACFVLPVYLGIGTQEQNRYCAPSISKFLSLSMTCTTVHLSCTSQ